MVVPTPPTDQQDGYISIPVVVGKYFILEVSSFGIFCVPLLLTSINYANN